jgi:hypothetical protein
MNKGKINNNMKQHSDTHVTVRSLSDAVVHAILGRQPNIFKNIEKLRQINDGSSPHVK